MKGGYAAIHTISGSEVGGKQGKVLCVSALGAQVRTRQPVRARPGSAGRTWRSEVDAGIRRQRRRRGLRRATSAEQGQDQDQGAGTPQVWSPRCGSAPPAGGHHTAVHPVESEPSEARLQRAPPACTLDSPHAGSSECPTPSTRERCFSTPRTRCAALMRGPHACSPALERSTSTARSHCRGLRRDHQPPHHGPP